VVVPDSIPLPLECALHLNAVAVARGDETCAYEQQDDVGALQLSVDLLVQIRAGKYSPVMPRVDETFMLQGRQVLLELIAVLLVVVGVREEDAGHEFSVFAGRVFCSAQKGARVEDRSAGSDRPLLTESGVLINFDEATSGRQAILC
jgi:hypothetical protein